MNSRLCNDLRKAMAAHQREANAQADRWFAREIRREMDLQGLVRRVSLAEMRERFPRAVA